MNVLIPLGILVTFICFLNRKNKKSIKKMLFLSFGCLALFLVLRFEFGPDYFSYWEIYESIQGVDVKYHKGYGASMEIAFLKYMQMFPNYTSFVAFNSLLWIIAMYWLCRKYADPNMYWFVLFILIFDPNTLTHVSVAMRQAFCSILFVVAFEFLNRNKPIIYCAIIIFAAQFHTSAILLLPLVLVHYDRNHFLTSSIFITCIISISLMSVLMGKNIVTDTLQPILFSNVEELQRYENYQIGVSSSITAFLFRLMSATILIYIVSATKKDTEQKYSVINKMAIVAISIQLFFGQTLISDRLLISLTPLLVVALSRLKNFMPKYFSYVTFTFVISIALYILSIKMNKGYAETFLIYHTIFDAPYIP